MIPAPTAVSAADCPTTMPVIEAVAAPPSPTSAPCQTEDRTLQTFLELRAEQLDTTRQLITSYSTLHKDAMRRLAKVLETMW